MKNRNKVIFGLVDHSVSRRKRANEFLDDVNKLVDWRPITKFLDKKLQRKANALVIQVILLLLVSPVFPLIKMFLMKQPFVVFAMD